MALLVFEEVSKSFPGVRALDCVSFEVHAGKTHALMGENGAGKSTLMKCLFGVYRKDSGRILLDGKEVSFKSSREALDAGVAMVHQELNVADKLSVEENTWLGRFPKYLGWLPFINKGEMRKKTTEAYERLGISIDPGRKMESLSTSLRQLSEIAKAISYNARVIVFDEPTSSLNSDEAERLFTVIEKLKQEGCAIIYISHKMEEILRIADTVTVMRDGRHIATERAEALTTDSIIRLMVGRELTARYPRAEHTVGEPLFSVKGLSAKYKSLTDVSLTVGKGEIVGIAGLDGSGRTELLECIFGTLTRSGGELTLNGKPILNRTPREAINCGFAFVTEERRRSGIFAILPIVDNTVISTLKSFLKGPLLSYGRMRLRTCEYIKKLGVKTPSERTKIRSLSGGNQQKVIFSRWMLTSPTVLLLDEPTRGIDVGAKFEIYQLIEELAGEGRGVIMVSSEMPELIGMCDRILVMSGGRLAGALERGCSEEEIMTYAARYL